MISRSIFLLSMVLASNCFAHPRSLAAGTSAHPLPSATQTSPGSNASLPAQGNAFYENSSGVPLLSLIESARTSIDIEIYEMEDPQVRASLRKALSRGVKVRIVHEPAPLGASCDVFGNRQAASHTGRARTTAHGSSADCADQQHLVTEVRDSGGAYVPFNSAQLCGLAGSACFQHGKILIADGKKALLSTGNFNSTNLCDKSANPSVCNRDYSYLIGDGQLVSTLESIFEHDLAGSRYDVSAELSGPAAETLTVSPVSLQPILTFIHSAQSRIQIQNQYLKQPEINSALIEAAKRGVKVEAMVASLCSFTASPKPNEITAEKRNYAPLVDAGVELKFFTKEIQVGGRHGYLHAKAIVVDGTRAWLGSINGSSESFLRNREFGIFFSDPGQVSELASFMKGDQGNAGARALEEDLACGK